MTIFLLSIVSSSYTFAESKIPMTDSINKGKYSVVTETKSGDITSLVYKRAGVYETVFTRVEIHCKARKMRSVGEGIGTIKNLKNYSEKGRWYEPVPEASSEDIFNYICK